LMLGSRKLGKMGLVAEMPLSRTMTTASGPPKPRLPVVVFESFDA
jgi:hypothetical protein